MAIQPALILPHGLPLRRMLIALGASLLVHVLLVGGWGSGKASTAPAVVPLQARLEMISAESLSSAVVDIPRLTTAPQPAILPRLASRAAVSGVATAEPGPGGAAGSGADLRFYLARELDRYPSPLSALSLDHDRGTGSVRLWVSIDQAGRVIDATVIDADPPGELERLAREQVLVTRFAPAWRDGRPVKSRVLLVLQQGA